MLRFNVDWTVSGSSTVEVEEKDVAEAGIDIRSFNSDKALFLALNEKYDGDLLYEAVNDWYEREAPELEMVYLENDYFDDEEEEF